MEQYFKKLGLIKYFIFLILSFVGSALVTVPVMKATGTATSALVIFVTSLGLYASMLLLIWGLSLTTRDRRLILAVAPSRARGNLLFILAPFLWSIPVNVSYVLFVERFFPDFYKKMLEATNLPQNFLNSSDPLSVFVLFLSVVVMAPIVEELMFRGILYNLLNKWIPLFPAALVSSAVFGLLHGTTFVQTAVIGLVLAFVYQVTGDLKMAMLGHAANNGLALFQGVLLENGIIREGQPSEMILSSVLLVGGLLMIALTVLYLRRNSPRSIYNDRAPLYKHALGRMVDAPVVPSDPPDL